MTATVVVFRYVIKRVSRTGGTPGRDQIARVEAKQDCITQLRVDEFFAWIGLGVVLYRYFHALSH